MFLGAQSRYMGQATSGGRGGTGRWVRSGSTDERVCRFRRRGNEPDGSGLSTSLSSALGFLHVDRRHEDLVAVAHWREGGAFTQVARRRRRGRVDLDMTSSESKPVASSRQDSHRPATGNRGPAVQTAPGCARGRCLPCIRAPREQVHACVAYRAQRRLSGSVTCSCPITWSKVSQAIPVRRAVVTSSFQLSTPTRVPRRAFHSVAGWFRQLLIDGLCTDEAGARLRVEAALCLARRSGYSRRRSNDRGGGVDHVLVFAPLPSHRRAPRVGAPATGALGLPHVRGRRLAPHGCVRRRGR